MFFPGSHDRDFQHRLPRTPVPSARCRLSRVRCMESGHQCECLSTSQVMWPSADHLGTRVQQVPGVGASGGLGCQGHGDCVKEGVKGARPGCPSLHLTPTAAHRPALCAHRHTQHLPLAGNRVACARDGAAPCVRDSWCGVLSKVNCASERGTLGSSFYLQNNLYSTWLFWKELCHLLNIFSYSRQNR